MKKTFMIMIAMGSLVAVSCVQSTSRANGSERDGARGGGAHKKAMLGKYDLDKNGVLSEVEKKTMLLERFDTNGNGVLDAGEVRRPKGAKRSS